jgi:peptide deformylase
VAEEHGEVVDHEDLDDEREARRLFALSRIRQYPDPVLRMEAKEVTDFDDDLRSLARLMTALMGDARGVGLAGNQVGFLRRVFVFAHTDSSEPRIAVNPRVTPRGDGRETADEGCLSLQGVLVPVERPAEVTLEAQDVDGESYRLDLSGLDARVVQHELDHLDATLIIDRTTREARRGAMAILRPPV